LWKEAAMTGNSAFEFVNERGWRRGMGNLLRAGFGGWWKTRMWWIQSLLWILIVNAILAGLLWGEGIGTAEAVALFAVFAGLFPAIAVIIIMQDAIVGEVEGGTAAWIMSKPVSRTAFVLSKWIVNTVGVLVTMVLLPGLVAYLQISLAGESWLDPLNFLAGLGVIGVNLIFFLSFTLMLGTIFNHRGPVIGSAMALAFGQQLLVGLSPILAKILPWFLVMPGDEVDQSIASAFILGIEPPFITPLYVACISILIFLAVSLWSFERKEF
jgi:ABC-2 type transport system permease protein